MTAAHTGVATTMAGGPARGSPDRVRWAEKRSIRAAARVGAGSVPEQGFEP